MQTRATRFLDLEHPPTPSLVVDLDVITERYQLLAAQLPSQRAWYAVKANPSRPILERLASLGACFDIASWHELASCLEVGAKATDCSFGNTAKRPDEVRRARAAGVDLFVFDAPAELEKLAANAPGASVFCRLAVDGGGSAWPLGRKFGAPPEAAAGLLLQARALGLRPRGISFHIGSQQQDTTAWDRAARLAAQVLEQGHAAGLELDLVNLGGGLPARYTADDHPAAHVAAVGAAIRTHLSHVPQIIVEPGRYLVADAGVMEASVLLVRQEAGTGKLWVHLDAGRYSGLTEGDTVAYPLTALRDGQPLAGALTEVVIAGPTCDSDDVFGLEQTYRLPATIQVGDRVRLATTGAYSTALDLLGYNGIVPPSLHFV